MTMMKDIRVSDFKESSRHAGTVIHAEYRKPYKSWERHLLLYKLERVIEGKVFSRMMENVRVIGVPDDYETDGHKVSIIEVYTTTSPTRESISAQTITKKILQLRTYIWVMTPIIVKLGYIMSTNHWLEIYEQDTKEQLDRILITQSEDIEDVIRAKVIRTSANSHMGN